MAAPDGKSVIAVDQWPAWSPDGNRIAYWSAYSDGEPAGVYVLDLRDSSRRWVSTGIAPAWSPTGDRLVVMLEEGLGIFSVDDPDSVAIIYRGDGFLPAWSPDGEWIAFDRVIQSVKGIWITRADGRGEMRRVTHEGLYARAPCWSPDGKRLLCAARVAGRTKDVCVVSIESGAIEQLTKTATADEHYPRWNPAGTSVAYSGGDGIYLLRVGGGAPVRIERSTPALRLVGDQSASWSPDGSRLVYNQVHPWIVNADGTSNHPLEP